MNEMTPVEALKFYRCFYHPAIGSMPVVVLDQLSNYTSLLFDISSLPWDNLLRNKKLLNETTAHYSKIIFLKSIDIFINRFV